MAVRSPSAQIIPMWWLNAHCSRVPNFVLYRQTISRKLYFQIRSRKQKDTHHIVWYPSSCITGADRRRYIFFKELAAVEIWFSNEFISVTNPSASFSREVCWFINTVASYLLSYLCSSLSDPINRDCRSSHSQCPIFLRGLGAHSHRQHESVRPGTLGLCKTCFVSSTAAINSSKTLKMSFVGESMFARK